jgi:NhaP-type Na+/H+ or K+/H+ antiporter
VDSSSNALLTLIFALTAGVVLIVLAHYFRISMIVPLLIGGIILGPNVLGIINPQTGLGNGLKTIISLAIAVILFEGGLSLKLSGLKQAPKVIKNLLSLGVVFTWFAISLTVYLIFDLPVSISLLAGSLVVVTGPTVVQPLIRRIRLNERLQNILYLEAILIYTICVFIGLIFF